MWSVVTESPHFDQHPRDLDGFDRFGLWAHIFKKRRFADVVAVVVPGEQIAALDRNLVPGLIGLLDTFVEDA